MTTSIKDNPMVDETTESDEPKISHVIHKEDHLRGYVLGEPVLALCGFIFVPSRDPNGYEMCPKCTEIVQKMIQED